MKEHSVIGLIVDQEATWDNETGNMIAPPTYLPGWFVIMTELYPVFEPYQIFPENPVRVYAGVETIFLEFADQAEWESFAWALEDEIVV